MCDKVFRSGLRKFCGRQPLKNVLSPLLNTLSYMKLKKFIFDHLNPTTSLTSFFLKKFVLFKVKTSEMRHA